MDTLGGGVLSTVEIDLFFEVNRYMYVHVLNVTWSGAVSPFYGAGSQ